MRVGITGHQRRPEIDWQWIADSISVELRNFTQVDQALSSLAVGSDQVFARVALDLGIPILAVIPTDDYETQFSGSDGETYRDLLSRSEILKMRCVGDHEHCFLEAGKEIVRRSDVVFAVWDGKPSEGVGGTADVVAFALSNARCVMHFDPADRAVSIL